MNYALKDSGKREAFATGSRRDTREGKGRFDLISPYAERRLALVLEMGAIKYGERNWEKGQPLGRYLDSALRHINCLKMGMHDEDHAAQAMWNLHSFIHTAELIEQVNLPRNLDDIGYVPLTPEYNVAEQARPEQAEECQSEQCEDVGYQATLPPAGWQNEEYVAPEDPGEPATSDEDEAEEGAPALWWRIRDYLQTNGPQKGAHMWDMVSLWGYTGFTKERAARDKAGAVVVLRNGVLYWCLNSQLTEDDRSEL